MYNMCMDKIGIEGDRVLGLHNQQPVEALRVFQYAEDNGRTGFLSLLG